MISPVSSVSSISSVGGASAPTSATSPAEGGFASKIGDALKSTSAAENQADMMARDIASGGQTPIHELMVATTKATLSVEMLSQVRNRAIQAYQEIMQMQV